MDTLHVGIRHALRTSRLQVDLEVGEETYALVGPSGAGKTTVLRSIAGLLKPDGGRVALNGTVWLDVERGIDMPPERRSVGLVFQEYALFPHLTVLENVAYGGRERAPALLESLRIAALAGARPAELSGGERQRVALARALAREPRTLLLDEPLSALDAHTRAHVRVELGALLRRLRLPTILVTHDFQDAAVLADRVGVIVDGRIVQTGTPADLVSAPASTFVADFTGGNLLPGTARPGPHGLTEVALDGGHVVLSTDPGDGRVGVVVHPWDVTIARELPRDSSQNHVRAPIASVVPIGNRARVRVGPLTADVTAASVERLGLAPGEVVIASFKATGTRLVELA